MDWQKVPDHVKWTNLMHVVENTGINWHEGKQISKPYMDQSVKVQLHQGQTRSVKTGRGVNIRMLHVTYFIHLR
jgi:citrate lyase alpha subunit